MLTGQSWTATTDNTGEASLRCDVDLRSSVAGDGDSFRPHQLPAHRLRPIGQPASTGRLARAVASDRWFARAERHGAAWRGRGRRSRGASACTDLVAARPSDHCKVAAVDGSAGTTVTATGGARTHSPGFVAGSNAAGGDGARPANRNERAELLLRRHARLLAGCARSSEPGDDPYQIDELWVHNGLWRDRRRDPDPEVGVQAAQESVCGGRDQAGSGVQSCASHRGNGGPEGQNQPGHP